MADNPDNLILRMLREIRGKLDEHDTKFAQIIGRFGEIDGRFAQIDGRFARIDAQFEQVVTHMDQRFDDVDQRFDDMKLLISHALGLSTATDFRSREHDARIRSAEAWRQRVDQAVAELNQRVKRLEEPVPG